MKLTFWIPLLFLFFVHQVSSAAFTIKRAMAKPQEMEDGLNKHRALFAKEANISNMHELKYDMGLERQAEFLSGCTGRQGPFIVVPFTDSDHWNKKSAAAIVHPLQTSVGCAEMKETCVEDGITIKGICLMGPQSKLKDSDFKRGAPGSECPGGKSSIDLCTSSSPVGGTSSSFASSVANVFFLCIFFIVMGK